MKAAVGLTLFVGGVYLLTASGHLGGQDQEYYYRTARSLAHEYTFAIDPLVFEGTEISGKRGHSGRFYGQYAPGLSIGIVPLIAVSDVLGKVGGDFELNYHWLRDKPDDLLERIFTSYFDIPVIALTAVLLVLLAKRLGYSERIGVSIGAVFALSTFAWGQARIINPEPLQTLLILSAFLLIFGATSKRAVLAGCALGLALLVKMTSILLLPALAILPDETGAPIFSKPKLLGLVALPVVGGLLAYGIYNYARFGDFFATGYNLSGPAAELAGHSLSSPIRGLYGLLFSTGRGLFWYAPPVLAGMAGCADFFRQNKRTAITCILAVTIWIAVHACFQAWDSGWGWGPRYLLPILPFMLIPAGELLKRRRGKLFCVALAIIGLLIQIPGVLVDFMASGRAGMTLFAETNPEHTASAFVAWRNFHLAGSEIVRNFALLRAGQLDVAWLTFRGTALPMITFALAAILLATGIALIRSTLYFAARSNTSAPQPQDSVNPEPPCP